MTSTVILVVEDNLDDIDLIREAMIEAVASIVVTPMGSVGAALQWLAAQPDDGLPVLVLTDHHLPDRLGHDLIAAMRACPRNCRLPVVMLSGDLCCPPGLTDTAWYGKPDSWNGWRELAKVLVARHLPQS